MTETCGTCGAAATGVWSAHWTGPHYVCGTHAPWRNTAVPLPSGFAYRSLPLFPLVITAPLHDRAPGRVPGSITA